MLHAGQRRRQGAHHLRPIQVAAPIAHAVAGNQHLGFDLLEAVQHRVAAHIGGANAPHRADAGRSQKGDHGFGNIRQVRGHAVTGLHALGLQVQGQ